MDGPDPEAAFSHTIVDSVVRDRVAVLTSDALADDRFEAGQSIRIQQIRSAMCVPLWDRDRVIGALHVDTPLRAGTFTADDLDLLTALGNFAAVAIERARLQSRIEHEERIRERLSRYHSPGVVDEIVTGGPQGVESVRTREVTVFFADIVGFTSSAETMDPEELSRFLERVFTFAADAIFEQGGLSTSSSGTPSWRSSARRSRSPTTRGAPSRRPRSSSRASRRGTPSGP